jgi:glycerophosphoryl diester phosphodiesterase
MFYLYLSPQGPGDVMTKTEMNGSLPALKIIDLHKGRIIHGVIVDRPVENTAWLIRQMEEANNGETIIVSSFSLIWLKYVKAAVPEAKLGLLVKERGNGWENACREINAYSVHFNRNIVNARLVEDAHEQRLNVFVGPVNSIGGIRLMKSLSVDGISANNCDEIMSFLSRLSPR